MVEEAVHVDSEKNIYIHTPFKKFVKQRKVCDFYLFQTLIETEYETWNSESFLFVL